MNWRRLLYTDLSALFSRDRAKPVRPTEDLWFIRASRALRWQPKDDWQQRIQYATPPRRWKGPTYALARPWRRDVLIVLEQLATIVRTNGDFSAGLLAAAREQFHLKRQERGRLFRRSLFVLFAAVFLLLLALIVTDPFLWHTSQDVILTAVGFVAIGFVVTFLFRRMNSGRRREAVFLAMSRAMTDGKTISESMRALNRFFPRFYGDMVAAGEKTGQLASVLESLGERSLNTIRLSQILRPTFYYLGVVFLVQMLIIAFLFTKVYPVFEEILQDFGAGPQAPSFIIAVVTGLHRTSASIYAYFDKGIASAFVEDPWLQPLFNLLLLLIVLAVLNAWRIRRRTRPVSGRLLLSPLFHVPWLRRLLIEGNLAAAAFMLSRLLQAGVTLPEALEDVAHADLHRAYRRKFARLRDAVLRGESFADACDKLKRLPRLPASFLGLIRLGEHSGMLDDALAQIAEHYQRDVEKHARLLTDTILPIGVIALGVLTLGVEWLMFGALVPLIDTLAMPL